MRLTSSDIPHFDAYQHKAPTSVAESQEMLVLPSQLPALGRCRPTPRFIVLAKFWHRPRALHVHICFFPTVAHVDDTTAQNGSKLDTGKHWAGR